MSKFIFSKLLFLLLIPTSILLAQTKDSLLIDLLREVDTNKQFKNEFITDTCCYNIVIIKDDIKELIKLNSLDNNKHIYIANDSLLTSNHITNYYQLIDFIHVANTARLQLANKLNNLTFSAYFKKQDSAWRILSTNLDKL